MKQIRINGNKEINLIIIIIYYLPPEMNLKSKQVRDKNYYFINPYKSDVHYEDYLHAGWEKDNY